MLITVVFEHFHYTKQCPYPKRCIAKEKSFSCTKSTFDYNLIMETHLLSSKDVSFFIYMLVVFFKKTGLFWFNSQTYVKSSFKLYIVVKIHYCMSQRRQSKRISFGGLLIATLSCATDVRFGLGQVKPVCLGIPHT